MLLTSAEVRRYFELVHHLRRIDELKVSSINVNADFSMYNGRVSLCLVKCVKGDEDPSVVHVVAGPSRDDILVAYFSHQSILTGSFDQFGLKKEKGEFGYSKEYHIALPSSDMTNVAADHVIYSLAGHIVHFFLKGAVMPGTLCANTYPELEQSIVKITDPKLD